MELITSAGNPLVKRIRRLQQRRHRRAESATVVHGIQPVRQAHEAGIPIETLVVAPDLLRAASAQQFVAAREDAGVPIARLSAELFTRVSDRDGPTADLWDPVTVKASMGAAFSVPTARLADAAELQRWARDRSAAVVTTAARAPQSLWQAEFPERVVVLLGSEQQGLDDATLADGDLAVNIPMTGTAESLNLAQAATVLLYEVWRQRSAG